MRHAPPLIGRVFLRLQRSAREQVERNLTQLGYALGTAEFDSLRRRTFENYAACFAEGLGALRQAPNVEMEQGDDAAALALLREQGAVVLTAHVGGWDVVGPALRSRADLPVLLVMGKEPDSRARRFHDVVRNQNGVSVHHVDHTDPLAALRLLQALTNKTIVAAQLDRAEPSMRVLQTEFLGRPFAVPEGVFRLASTAQVPLIVALSHRVGFFDYRLRCSTPIRLVARADEAQLEVAAQSCVAFLEAFVRSHPTQWFRFG